MPTTLKESQLGRCKDIMGNLAKNIAESHARGIIDTVNEIFEDSDEGKATLDVPITLKIKRELDKGYTFSAKIEIKKVEKVTDCLKDVKYNPDIPDLPGMADPATHPPKGDAKAQEPKKEEPKDAAKVDAAKVDAAEPVKPSEPKKEEAAQESKKFGDDGKVFIFDDGELEIVDYEDVKNDVKDQDFVKIKGEVAKLSGADLQKNLSVVFRSGVRCLVRCKEADKTVYAMWQHADAKDRVAKAKAAQDALAASKVDVKPEGKAEEPKAEGQSQAPEKGEAGNPASESGMELCNDPHKDGVRKCLKAKGHEGRHYYGPAVAKDAATPASATQPETKPEAQPEDKTVADPVVADSATTQPAKTSSLTDEDKGKGAAWCLTKYDIKVCEAEAVLKREGKMPITGDKKLQEVPSAQKFVLDNIGQVEKWVLDLRKEEAARKKSAA